MEFKIWDIVEVRVYPLDHVFQNAVASVGMITWYDRHVSWWKEVFMYFVNGKFEWSWRLKLLSSKKEW